jgi:hypothetical protein
MATRLGTAGGGMHAGSDHLQVQQWEATQWLIEYVEDNNDNNEDASWSGWWSPDHVIDTYEPAVGEETGKFTSYRPEYSEEKLHRIDIGERGRAILTACIEGQEPEDLMSQWQNEIMNS